jgi:hypothetical protein
MLTYAVAYADVCERMLTYADLEYLRFAVLCPQLLQRVSCVLHLY